MNLGQTTAREEEPTALAQLMRSERWLVGSIVFGAFGLVALTLVLATRRLGMLSSASVLGAGTVPSLDLGYRPLFGTAPPVVQSQSQQSSMLTVPLAIDRSLRIFQPPPGAKNWRIQARNIGPAGSFIILSTDSACSGPSVITIPGGSGGYNEFQIAPNQSLYGRATIAGTEVTIVASASS